MGRTVVVKSDNQLAGFGDLQGEVLWESDPDETGQFVHLAEVDDGTIFLSGTDMETPWGSWVSFPVRGEHLVALAGVLLEFWCEPEPVCEAEDPFEDDAPEG